MKIRALIDHGARCPSEGLRQLWSEPGSALGLRLPVDPPHHLPYPAALRLVPLYLWRLLLCLHHRAEAWCRHPLSGGPQSVRTEGAPSFPDGFLQYAEENGEYVLGICYRMLLIVHKLGGAVTVRVKQEYGKMEISVEKEKCGLYGPEALSGTLDGVGEPWGLGSQVAGRRDSRRRREDYRARWQQLRTTPEGFMGLSIIEGDAGGIAERC